jgi:hypothetical protein
MCQGSIHIMYVPELWESCLMLIYSPLSAYFDDVIPQQPALSNDGKQRQPALDDFTSPIDWTRRARTQAARRAHSQQLRPVHQRNG